MKVVEHPFGLPSLQTHVAWLFFLVYGGRCRLVFHASAHCLVMHRGQARLTAEKVGRQGWHVCAAGAFSSCSERSTRAPGQLRPQAPMCNLSTGEQQTMVQRWK